MQKINEKLLVNSDSDEISFSSESLSCCICIVDMINSTGLTSRIGTSKMMRKFYSIFINSVAYIAKMHDASILKNVGDSVMFYFPHTSDLNNEDAFNKVLECGNVMTTLHKSINAKMNKELLPSIKYRISIDYGKVEIAKSITSTTCDLFGPTVNICAKINSKAQSNGIVIGSDFYIVLKSFPILQKNYEFKLIGECSTGNKQSYPVYTVNKSEALQAYMTNRNAKQ
jgi:class 3 adenylate cyclase